MMHETPAELLAFLGMSAINVADVGLEVCFVVVQGMNLLIAYFLISHILTALQFEEESGIYLFYYSQIMTRTEYYLKKVMFSLLSGLLLWMGYIGECMVAMWAIQKNLAIANGQTTSLLLKMGMHGVIVMLLFFSLGLLYAVKKNRYFTVESYAATVVMISFLLGNSYKIPELLAYYRRAQMLDTGIAGNLALILHKINIVSPFAELNLFSISAADKSSVTLLLYMIIAVAICVLSLYMFEKREFD